MLLFNTCKCYDGLKRASFYYQNKSKYTTLCLSYHSIKIRKLDQNITITDTQIYIVIAWLVKKQSYKIIRQNIKNSLYLQKCFV